MLSKYTLKCLFPSKKATRFGLKHTTSTLFTRLSVFNTQGTIMAKVDTCCFYIEEFNLIPLLDLGFELYT